MSLLFAVDPGIRGCGVAAFEDRRLVRAGYVINPLESGCRSEESAAMAFNVAVWTGERAAILVVEWPRVYASRIRAGEAKGDPNDLLALAGVVSAIAAHWEKRGSVFSYVPSEWKGQIPKDICGARIMNRLSVAEGSLITAVKPASKRHNTIDAVGLGLHHLGRGVLQKQVSQ